MTARRYRPGRQHRWAGFNPATQPGTLDDDLPTRSYDESAAIGSRVRLERIPLKQARRAVVVA